MKFKSTRRFVQLVAVLLGAMVVASVASVSWAQPILRDGDTLAICGDSITEQRQYSLLIETYLLACKPVRNVRVVQIGWSGEWADMFAGRVKTDVLPFRPTVVTTCYGMNDGGYTTMKPETGTKYHNSLKQAVDTLKSNGVRTVLVGSPGAVDTFTYKAKNGADAASYNNTLAALRGEAANVAKETSSPFANLHDTMLDAMAKAKAKYGEKFPFSGGDGVHPSVAGHFVMAYTFLKEMGFTGDLGTITLDLSSNQNTATAGHRIVSAANSVVTIESTRYPFCFSGDPNSAENEQSMLPFIPFVDELDRLTLVVKGAGSGKIRVTWGDKVADFTADELAKGINLVAVFPDNPFTANFNAVKAAVRTQQEFETVLTKNLLHAAPDWKRQMPEGTDKVDAFIDVAMKHDRTLFNAAAAEANKPVQHTIKIEMVQ